MRVGITMFREITEEKAKLARQLGVSSLVVHTPDLGGEGYWRFSDLLHLKEHARAEGLELVAIENMPRSWYDKIMLGLEGKEEQIECWCRTLENMGKAGIKVLGYDWMLGGVSRTCMHSKGRGGARVTEFDYELVRNAPAEKMDAQYADALLMNISAEDLWKNCLAFLKEVIPVAESSGVVMALHPDDPPISQLGGMNRIFCSVDAFKKSMEEVPSESNRIEFCQGTFAEMGCDIYGTIKAFGKRIAYAHLRNVKGRVPKFSEAFIDEGDIDMLEAMRAYKEGGFDGLLLPDHPPVMVGDEIWSPFFPVGGDRGWSYTIGYIKGLLRAL
ncbi:MAG: mannonate dehydratase [Candidatus Thermoplasmatota archaeon]|nr:mannonate dehydratase [Candidatus Thermoplasmatota archaeon]